MPAVRHLADNITIVLLYQTSQTLPLYRDIPAVKAASNDRDPNMVRLLSLLALYIQLIKLLEHM